MPSVIDTPELIKYVETHELTTHELTIERPQPRRAHRGFWHTLAHGITKHLTHTPRVQQMPLDGRSRPFEAPMDRIAREYPQISILALAII